MFTTIITRGMTARTKDQCKYNSCFVKGNLDNIKQSILTGQISS